MTDLAKEWFARNRQWGQWGCPGTCDLENKRLIRLFKETWDRLPEHDQALLREILYVVQEETNVTRKKAAIGSAHSFHGESVLNGMGYIADASYVVTLYPDEEWSDTVWIGVIAHELAHVALRHQSWAPSLAVMLQFPEDRKAYEKIKQVMEWQADHRAWVWGFAEEIQGVWKATGRDRPLWAFQYEPDELGLPLEAVEDD